jgi:hypothetical protein
MGMFIPCIKRGVSGDKRKQVEEIFEVPEAVKTDHRKIH